MSALDDLKRDLQQSFDPTAVTIRLKVEGGDRSYDLLLGELRAILAAPFNKAVIAPEPDIKVKSEWISPVGDPTVKAYPPPPWQRTNRLGFEYDLLLPNGQSKKQIHTGDDLNLPEKTDLNQPVRAIHDGTVIFAGDGGGTWLGVVVIKHPHDNTFTAARYAHLAGIQVRQGDPVKVGQIVGFIGDPTLRAGFEPHLHFDLGNTGDAWLVNTPLDWPGTKMDVVLAHYQDPALFMKARIEPKVVKPVTPPAPEAKGKLFIVDEAAGVNVRQQPSTSATVLTALPKGTTLKLDKEQTSGAFTFGQIVDIAPNWSLAINGWVAKNFLTPAAEAAATPAPVAPIAPVIPIAPIAPIAPVNPAVTGKSVGIHVAFNGNPGDILGVVDRLAKAGRPVPLVVVVTDSTLCEAIKQVSPTTTTVYRYVAGPGDPSPFGRDENAAGWRNGADWFEEFWLQHSKVKGVDFHQMYNEVSFANNTQSEAYARKVNQFELELMQRANERGVKVTIGNYMPGVPEKRHIDQLRPALAFAEQFGHALCYHAYTYPNNPTSFSDQAEFFALRWKSWLDPYPRLRVVLGEAGIFTSPRFRGTDTLVQMMTELDILLKPLRAAGRRVDAAYWTIRGQNDANWRFDDFTNALNEYEMWMKR
ncbi:MAG: M23 family metallopeptidase [Anaerolineae bacterium]|nr:M23 family metallopeptidase [Anaerolineae bacterium]